MIVTVRVILMITFLTIMVMRFWVYSNWFRYFVYFSNWAHTVATFYFMFLVYFTYHSSGQFVRRTQTKIPGDDNGFSLGRKACVLTGQISFCFSWLVMILYMTTPFDHEPISVEQGV